jgi:type I restriction enzyme S subunit
VSVVLSEHLPLLATAPDGIQKLRGLILELAVRGKLVPQDPNDEPASELLERITRERARLVMDKGKKSKETPVVGEEAWPFEVPESWQWIRFAQLNPEFQNGESSRGETSGTEIIVLRLADISKGEISVADTRSVILPEGSIAKYQLLKNDLLIIRVNGSAEIVGRLILCNEGLPAIYCDHFIRVRIGDTSISHRFLRVIGDAPVTRRQIQNLFITTAGQKTVNQGHIGGLIIPLPPLAEQHRIVAKVDELMALCDQLEAEQVGAEAAHARLVDTLLATLTQSYDATDLATNWQRLVEHFDTLLTTESSLHALKQTILQLAVMGKLVPQDANDEPASELLGRIAQEKVRLEAKGGRKNQKVMPIIRTDRLPSGWEAATLPELCEIGGGATPSKANSVYWGEGLPWVSPKDMKVEHISDAQDHVTECALNETRLPRIPTGSLLIVVRGMILVHSFPVATTQVEVAINQDMKSLTPFISEMKSYLALALRGWKQQILELVDRSTHGTCKLQSEKLFSFHFGIPPLAEQHRIIAKVDELMTLCDRLKADLAESHSHQKRLASTLIETALQAA